jgi:hypothetical protein
MKKIMAMVVFMAVLGCTLLLVAQQAGAQAASDQPANTPAPATPEAAAAPAEPASTASESVAQAAMKKSADEKKYLFLFVSENDSPETATAKGAVEAAAAKISDKANVSFINSTSAAEKETVDKFRLQGAPMPIVLALAPNGAITGAYFNEKLKDPQLQDSIAGTSEQQCIKALQDGKLVFLCAQNATTTANDTAMQGVNDFKADEKFAKFTEVVTLDPASAADQPFLTKLRIDPKITEASTTLVAPPGSLVSQVSGATTKDVFVTALTAATSGACGPKGCGPKGCEPAK